MGKHIHRSIKEPHREGLTWEERWQGIDQGLIACWERGREKRDQEPELAKCAERGELPVLAWKGGVSKKIKTKKKYGTLFYLATWQGLRGEDLDVDLDKETEIVCSKTGICVIFTPDVKKYANA